MNQTTFPPVDEQLQRLRRGVADLVSEEQLRAKLERSRQNGLPLTIKAGFDPSSPDLHLGHTVLLRKMKQFQQFGHRAVFVVGDFTGMIGDPSGKKATRPQLSREEVESNARTYEQQVFRLLDPKTTVIDYNSRWLNELGSSGLIRLAGSYTLARMMERDDFRSRFATNQPIGLHELLYPLVQGYDSVALEADVELGGHDQIFNLLVGRDLMKDREMEPQVVLTVPLLVGLDGVEKMSKSLGNHIAVEDSAKEIYGKTMSIPDDLMWDWLIALTDLPQDDVDARRQQVSEGTLHPKAVKQELARSMTAEYHGMNAAAAAAAEFEAVFSTGGVPESVPEISLTGPQRLAQVLAAAHLASSNREARRLLEQGAVSINGERVSDPASKLTAQSDAYLVKVGKRRFVRIRIE